MITSVSALWQKDETFAGGVGQLGRQKSEDRQTDGRTPDRCFTLAAMDAASVTIITMTIKSNILTYLILHYYSILALY